MLKLLKIDPYLETIYPVEVNDSLAALCRQIGARRLTIAGQQPTSQVTGADDECPDAAYCDEEALHTPYWPPAFRLRTTGHVIYGCALWHRVTPGGQLRPPAWTQPDLMAQVEFLGFMPLSSDLEDLPRLDDESLPLDAPDF